MRRYIVPLLLLLASAPLLASAAHAQITLRQSTAVSIKLGPFVDSTDGVTAETALTIAQADVRLAKNDAAWAQKTEATSCTHEENGWYECPLDATDTNTIGILIVNVNETGALPVWRTFQVVEESIYDSCCASAAAPLTASDVWSNATRTLSASTNIVLAKGTGITGFNDLDAAGVRSAVGLTSANLDTQLSGIESGISWNAAWDAEVQSEVEEGINVVLEQVARADAAIVNCTVNTAFFAGSTTTVACILTDRDDGAITAASGDLEGRELLVLSGAQIYEGRYITDTTWDGVNSELQLTLSRALPGTLADAVTAIIR